MIRCTLFDVDGTLIHSYPGIYNAYRFAFEQMQLDFRESHLSGRRSAVPSPTHLRGCTAWDPQRHRRPSAITAPIIRQGGAMRPPPIRGFRTRSVTCERLDTGLEQRH